MLKLFKRLGHTFLTPNNNNKVSKEQINHCDTITECSFGEYGQNCDGRCYCEDGTCNVITGQCTGSCAPGFEGDFCHIGM